MNRVVITGCAAVIVLLAGCKCGCLMGTTPAEDLAQVVPADDDASIQGSKG